MINFDQCLYSLKLSFLSFLSLKQAKGGSLRAVYREKCLYFSVLNVNEIILN